MNCDGIKSFLPDYWNRTLTGTEELEVEAHLDECTACREEAERISELWRGLALIPAVEPTPALRERFYESLRAYRHGEESGGGRSWIRKLAGLWPRQTAWQVAISLGCLVAGLALGLQWQGTPDKEIAQLHSDIDNMRQLVALSLLRQESASERLRGVSWANQVAPADTEVVAALVESVNHDPSVNVRLAAVNALRAFGSSPLVRQAVSEGMGQQSAPLVQVALIELAVDLKERRAETALRELSKNPTADPGVRERANWALERLQ